MAKAKNSSPGQGVSFDVANTVKWRVLFFFAFLYGAYKGVKPILKKRAIERDRKNAADPETLVTCKCELCGSPITYPFKRDGTVVNCPDCNGETRLDL